MISKNKKKVILVASALAFAAGSAHAIVIAGVDYNNNLSFPTLSTAVFTAPQTYNLTGDLSGWAVKISGQFSDAAYALNPSRPYSVSTTNLSGFPFENSQFPGAEGLYFQELPDLYAGNNITVTFSFEFIRSGGLNSLMLAVYGGESSDHEIDMLTNTGSVFSNYSTLNLTSATGQGTNTATFSTIPDPVGNGEFIATTGVNDGDIITWTYDYQFSGAGKNMIAFNAASVPEPSSGLIVAATMLLGVFRRSRK